jgi:hypothetical protein
VIPPAPGPGYAWLNGYWHWDGDEYLWHRGRWDVRPAPGYVWLHHGWTQDRDRYRLMPGRWVRRGYHPPYAFVHPTPRFQRLDHTRERRPGLPPR